MRFFIPTVLFTSLVSPVLGGRLISRNDVGTAAIIGVFDQPGCTGSQTDLSQSAGEHWGTCSNLPGRSMKVWWAAKGCHVLLHNDRECKTAPSGHAFWSDECYNIDDKYAWWAYCV
ncbi:hypothetical protein F4803DRAFT_296952 [Xylaria telfairii]|nr:hypothetical protein F4803DRAFT_296952 [Xylaria telfairii]